MVPKGRKIVQKLDEKVSRGPENVPNIPLKSVPKSYKSPQTELKHIYQNKPFCSFRPLKETLDPLHPQIPWSPLISKPFENHSIS